MKYSCSLAEKIGRKYNLAPEQVWPSMLQSLGTSWRPRGRDLSQELSKAADRLEAELRRLGLPLNRPAQDSDDEGRDMARKAMSGNPATAALLAEMERGWRRRDRKG